MSRIIVFDVNETLLDVHALAPNFVRMFGEEQVLTEWFLQLLLHSEACMLAGPYFDFAALAVATTEMLAAARSKTITDRQKTDLVNAILTLPPHEDVKHALTYLRSRGLRLVTLTNSSQNAVEQQLRNASLSEFFERNFSIDAIQRYKPTRQAYEMVASELRVTTADLRLVAAHSWDVAGAIRAGCAAAFVARPGKALFPLFPEPDITGADLRAVAERIVEREVTPS